MFCLENLIYRCRYQTDTSVWINCILHFCKGKREWKRGPGDSFSLFGSKHISVWKTSICLKPTSQTIHCISLCLTIILYPTHDICLHVCSASWDTRPGLLCRLDSTTRPCYAVSSEPWMKWMSEVYVCINPKGNNMSMRLWTPLYVYISMIFYGNFWKTTSNI